MKEPIFERVLRHKRKARIKPYLFKHFPRASQPRLLDIGCGWDARLLHDLAPHISRGVGIDFKAPQIKTDTLETFQTTLEKTLPFEDRSFDVVVMLAVLEHLEHHRDIVRDIARVLKPGGGLFLTTPSWYSKPLLEFLSFRLGIVNADEIADHKRYFNQSDLCELIDTTPNLSLVEHKYFQFYMNNFVFAQRSTS